MALVSVSTGVLLFDVSLAINVPALIVTLLLFICSMWGVSMILGALGVMVRGANMISNLVFPIVSLLGGLMYPISQMPDPIRIPARALPFGYGTQAIVNTITKDASLRAIWPDLGPLIGFAIILPLLGVLAFRTVERSVRRQGYLELS